jgi:penicillin-binding protein 2
MVLSFDVFFYQVGQMLGVDRLAKYSKGLGLGQATGFDPDHEKLGLVPTSAWKRRRLGEPWHAGETLSVAIGQGFNLVTPIQQFVIISAVANGGEIVVPQVVSRVQGSEGKDLAVFEPETQGRAPASPATIRLLREALRGVVQDPRGTGQKARVQGVDVGGKTGTAQVVKLHDKAKEQRGPGSYELRDHAWFVCFAPVEDAQIAVAVVVEHGGHGGSEAGPVAQRVLQAFFQKKRVQDKESASKDAEISAGSLDDRGNYPGIGRDRDRQPL